MSKSSSSIIISSSSFLSFSFEESGDVSQHEYSIVKSIILLFFDNSNSSRQSSICLSNFHIYGPSSSDFYPPYDRSMPYNQSLHMIVSPESHTKSQIDFHGSFILCNF